MTPASVDVVSSSSRQSTTRRGQLPPGPHAPEFFQTLAWLRAPGPFLERCHARYGDIFSIRVAREGTWIMLADPAAARDVFTAEPAKLHAGEANAVLRPILGDDSLLISDGRAHMERRKLMLAGFHHNHTRDLYRLTGEVVQREVASWPLKKPFRLLPSMQTITFGVISHAVLGPLQAPSQERVRVTLRRLLDWLGDTKSMVALVCLGPGNALRLTALRNLLREVDQTIHEQIRLRRSDARLADRQDMLSLLIRARYPDGSTMSDSDLRDQVLTLLVAGHETTATALSWLFELLLRSPSCVQRVRAELASEQSAYLDAACKEALRLRAVLPIVGRKLLAPLRLGGWTLPAGTKVAPCIYLVHRRPDLYPRPSSFRPERFLDQSSGGYAWIPFGGGVRRCLGATLALEEMQVIAGEILKLCELRPARSRGEAVRRRSLTLSPARGSEVVLERRLLGDVRSGRGEMAVLPET